MNTIPAWAVPGGNDRLYMGWILRGDKGLGVIGDGLRRKRMVTLEETGFWDAEEAGLIPKDVGWALLETDLIVRGIAGDMYVYVFAFTQWLVTVRLVEFAAAAASAGMRIGIETRGCAAGLEVEPAAKELAHRLGVEIGMVDPEVIPR